MGITTALFTSLSGLETNSNMLSVAGNNIANVNTTAYKRSRISFETQISQTFANGSAPTADLGGTNPAQVGLGARLGSIRRDFSSGALQPTGVSTDMAIEGNGFFVVDVNGQRRFTRDGGFTLDSNFNLTMAGNGGLVQGFGIDDDFNIIEGATTDLRIPKGILTVTEPTTEVKISGNLNSGGDAATLGSITSSEVLFSDPGATTFATAGTALDSLHNAAGTQLFTAGDIITITGATKGGAAIPDTTFAVSAVPVAGTDANGTALSEFMTFLDDIFGIDTTISGGLSVTAGVLDIESNTGVANTIRLADANLVVNQATAPATPMQFSQTQDADGESVRTTFSAYDSLGNELSVDLTAVLETKDTTGTTWRVYLQSSDDSDLDRVLSTTTATFDTEGQLISLTDTAVSIDRIGTGATSPLAFDVLFEDPFGSVTSFADSVSQASAFSQDGVPIGTLEDFTVGEDGTITGIFSNGLLRSLGRVVLSTFANNEGLEEVGGNLYRASVNSGDANIVNPTTAGSGRVVGRTLELSNVDLAQEFVSLINANTGFSANARVLSTSDDLIQELLATVL